MCFTLISAATSSESPSASVSKAASVAAASASISKTAPASSTSGPSLGSEDAALASGCPGAAPSPAPAAHVLQHRGVLEHVGEDQEADLGAPDVNVLQLGHPPVPVGHGHARHLAVHVVLGLDQLASINLKHTDIVDVLLYFIGRLLR